MIHYFVYGGNVAMWFSMFGGSVAILGAAAWFVIWKFEYKEKT